MNVVHPHRFVAEQNIEIGGFLTDSAATEHDNEDNGRQGDENFWTVTGHGRYSKPAHRQPWVATVGIKTKHRRIDRSRYNFRDSFPPFLRVRTHMPGTSLIAILTLTTIVGKDSAAL
jgi:hypothetical protein